MGNLTFLFQNILAPTAVTVMVCRAHGDRVNKQILDSNNKHAGDILESTGKNANHINWNDNRQGTEQNREFKYKPNDWQVIVICNHRNK